MSEQQSRSSQRPFRDTADESSRRRTSSLPAALHEQILDRPSGQPISDVRETFLPHRTLHDAPVRPYLPPIALAPPGRTDSNPNILPSLRDAIGPIDDIAIPTALRSTSASPCPAASEYREREHYRISRHYSQEPQLDIRESRPVISHSAELEPPRSYRLAPVQGTDVSNIARPSSARDSAYFFEELAIEPPLIDPPSIEGATIEGAAFGGTEGTEGVADVDELQETTDDDGQPHLGTSSAAPSRTGSEGATRAPRTKIEVACDFCRKRKMKCDGLRPTCKNCERKGVACSYIPVVRRRGPGKKKKATDTRSKKTNKRTETEAKQTKGKGKEKATDPAVPVMQDPEEAASSQEASGSGLQLESTPHHYSQMFSQPGPSSELYLPPPYHHMEPSPRGGERPSALPGPNLSPFSSAGLHLPPYPHEHEQFPPFGRSPPPFGGGHLFLPGHSPTMGSREFVDPYAGVNVNIPESSGSMLSEAGPPQFPVHSGARTTSMVSSSPGSGEGELGRYARRRRTSRRARSVQQHEQGGHELEEGEIDEAGPSRGIRR